MDALLKFKLNSWPERFTMQSVFVTLFEPRRFYPYLVPMVYRAFASPDRVAKWWGQTNLFAIGKHGRFFYCFLKWHSNPVNTWCRPDQSDALWRLRIQSQPWHLFWGHTRGALANGVPL